MTGDPSRKRDEGKTGGDEGPRELGKSAEMTG